jgi:hypothetical protein
MPKTARKKPTTRKPRKPPAPKIYQLAFGVKVTTLAFRRQDAVEQTKWMLESMAEALNAAGGPAMEMETPKMLAAKQVGVVDLES